MPTRPLLIVATLVISMGAAARPAASAAAPQGAQAAAAAATGTDLVVTVGEGLVRAVPDRATVTLTAEARAKSPREAQRQNAQAMTAVQQALRGAGLAETAVRTRAYELQPEFDYRDGKQALRGYLARNSIEVRLDDVGRVGEIIDLAVGSGATSVGDIQFELADRAAREREALRLAVVDARARAEAMAAGLGRALAAVVRVEEQGAVETPPPMPRAMAMRAEAMAASAPAPPVAPGEVELRARVTLTARLK
jgi:hypothetical protein